MNSLRLMDMRADIVRTQTTTETNPFGQLAEGVDTTVATGVCCRIWNGKQDITVNGRVVAAVGLWYGIADERADIRNGDRVTNFEDGRGNDLFPEDLYPADLGGNRPFTVTVLRSVKEPGKHIGLTLESIDGVSHG